MKSLLSLSLLLLATGFTLPAEADGIVVDKVYHPYVLSNERKAEWRLISHQREEKNILAQRVGFGGAVAEKFAIEAFLVGERDRDDQFGLQSYEIEARWQLVEQGRYWGDWGLIMEIEKEHQVDNYEVNTGLVFEKEFGRTSLTMNLFTIYEWGQTVANEWETEFRAQYRYRMRSQFQPSIELYAGEEFLGIGPGFIGLHRFKGQKQLKWEAGFITEIAHAQKDHSFRMALEYEF